MVKHHRVPTKHRNRIIKVQNVAFRATQQLETMDDKKLETYEHMCVMVFTGGGYNGWISDVRLDQDPVGLQARIFIG